MSASESSDERFAVRATADSHFSWIRTRLSAERTLMSWMRTSVSLIGFGFTIVQFFERFESMERVEAAIRPDAPRYFGLALILAGVCALLVSLWQYRNLLRYLQTGPYEVLSGIDAIRHNTPTVATAVVVLAIGIFAFIAVLTRLA